MIFCLLCSFVSYIDKYDYTTYMYIVHIRIPTYWHLHTEILLRWEQRLDSGTTKELFFLRTPSGPCLPDKSHGIGHTGRTSRKRLLRSELYLSMKGLVDIRFSTLCGGGWLACDALPYSIKDCHLTESYSTLVNITHHSYLTIAGIFLVMSMGQIIWSWLRVRFM